MKAVLIPVKSFAQSKQRLAPYYSAADRAALAASLCEDFFHIVAEARGIDRVFVVSQEPRALAWARERGWETIVETAQISESHSVDAASRQCAEQGVDVLLRLPIDIPLVTPGEIEALFVEVENAPSVVIVPSRDGTGTNALLRSPPTLFPSHFGPDSFALHLDEAKRCDARLLILRNPRIELDIDEIDDLRALAGLVPPDSALAEWLHAHVFNN
ncbi:MAG: 2-phospho-L-lactate/phosphoenolpyruvate guanylyltransferase [Alphaproteobacteria bacterium]|nr:2-phospho-L-lactate/phosphoenolpyruvate guanylyltransferase [Alphaproteobacteria bacterium]